MLLGTRVSVRGHAGPRACGGTVQAQGARSPRRVHGGTVQARRDPSPAELDPREAHLPLCCSRDCVVLPLAQPVVASHFTVHGTEFRGTCPLKGIGFIVTWGVWVAGPTALPSSAQGPWHSRMWCWAPEGAESRRASCPHAWDACA